MTDITLTESNSKDFEKAVNEEMTQPIKHFERELATIRTGRAHASLVEDVKVECYGGTSTLRIRELATISVPEVRMITIQPWDQSVIADIERALSNSEIGVTPINDGNLIRLRLPEMSADRRAELVKILHKKLEECKIGIRNIRKEFNNLVRDSLKDKAISEDHAKRLNDSLQKITDLFIEKANNMSTKKEGDLKGI